MASNLYAAIEALNKARSGVGLLDYTDLIKQAQLQNCGPRDESCIASNVSKQAQVEDYWAAHQGGLPDNTVISFVPLTTSQVQQFYDPQNIANGGNVVPIGNMFVNGGNPSYTSHDPAGNNNQGYQAKFGFAVSRVGQSYIVGDTWEITISNGKPGASVKASANGTTSNEGNLDGNGNLVISGSFDNSTVGNWDEVWFVDGVQVGHITFSVGQPASKNTNGSLTTPSVLTDINPQVGSMSNFLTEKIFGLEGWMWGVIVVGGIVLLKRR